VALFYRESACEKRARRTAAAGRRDPARPKKEAGNGPTGPLCCTVEEGATKGRALPVNQSFWQVVGFVVLAAVVLATGFGALGASLPPGAF
jgi:hypothetical protein